MSLLLAAGTGRRVARLAHLSGVSADQIVYLAPTDSTLSLQGLLVAGMVIGALGVLVDLTVSQASTVVALRRANPELGFRRLFHGATDVGHDHIAATVNTLVFALCRRRPPGTADLHHRAPIVHRCNQRRSRRRRDHRRARRLDRADPVPAAHHRPRRTARNPPERPTLSTTQVSTPTPTERLRSCRSA